MTTNTGSMNTSGITGITFHNIDGDNLYQRAVLDSVIAGTSTITLTTVSAPYAGSSTFTVNSISAATNQVTFNVTMTFSDPGAVQPPVGHYVYAWFENVAQIGAQGPTGYKGRTGATGDANTTPGPRGTQGVVGYTGPAGNNQLIQGGVGATGPIGPRGANQTTTGAQGYRGHQGPRGNQGSQGARGYQGVAGPAGPQGARGAQGAKGAQGAAASTATALNAQSPYANVHWVPNTGASGPIMSATNGMYGVDSGLFVGW